MKQKLKNACKELRGNRGSGIAVVMMAMVLLTLMAATLLNMTYMGYKIKAEDRKQKEDYFIATAAMDEIRAGLQGIVSDSIAAAYKDVLVNYNDTHSELDNNFKRKFIENIGINKDKLSDLLTNPDGIEVICNEIKTDSNIVLDNISLTYTNSAGNKVTVKTDIVISIPSFNGDWDYDKLVQYRNWSIE